MARGGSPEQININVKVNGAKDAAEQIRQISRSVFEAKVLLNQPIRVNLGLRELGERTKQVKGELHSAAQAVRIFRTLLVATGVEAFAKSLIEMTDGLTNLQNKIKVVTATHGEFLLGMKSVVDIAHETRTSLESVATVYSRTTRSIEGLGKSQSETAQFTLTLAKAVQVGGSTAVEASNAMIQLSQGLASGTLKGDELRSVLEQLPVVSKLIAAHMGVTVGQLRLLGLQGKLTSEQVFDSIIAGTDEMAVKFAKMTPTVAQAWEVFKNSAIQASAIFQPLMTQIAKGLIYVGDNFNTAVKGALSFAYALGTLVAAEAIPRVIAGLKALAIATASNPWGAIATAIAMATAALIPFADKIGDTRNTTVTLKDVWTAFANDFTSWIRESAGKVQDLFGVSHIKVFVLSLEEVLMRLAKIADLVHLIMNPQVTVGIALGDEDAIAEGGANRRGMKKFISNARGAAADRHAQEFQDKSREVNERFNAFMADHMPGAHPKGPPIAPVAKKEGGLTFAELIDKMKQEQEVAKQTPFESGVTKEFFAKMQSLKDSVRNNLVTHAGRGGKEDKEMQQLQGMIRLEHELAEAQKFVRYWDEQIAEAKKKRMQISIDLGDKEEEARRKNTQQVQASDRAVTEGLGPFTAYNKEVEKFNDYLFRHPENRSFVEEAVLKMGYAYTTFAPIFDGVSASIADAAANSLVFGENMHKALTQIAKDLTAKSMSALFQLGFNALIGTPMAGINGGTQLAGASPGAGTSFGGPATFSGGNYNPGATGGAGGAFASGGYTGSGHGRGDIAGTVHGQEFVVNANATARNRAMLESMNAGRPVGGGGANVTVHNYAGAAVETSTNDDGSLEIRINKAIANQAPRIIAADLRNPNSRTSKALSSTYDVPRRN